VLYLETLEPPVSACALADQIGSTYQVAPTNGLSKRGPLLVEELELLFGTELDVLTLDDVDVATDELELVLTLEDEVATELDVLTLDEELTTELDDDTPQPATTP